MYVHGGTSSTIVRINTFAKLKERRTHDVQPSDEKAQIGLSKEYMYNVLQCTVA
jgi:hypothetical protein